jgi:hypothetical protein
MQYRPILEPAKLDSMELKLKKMKSLSTQLNTEVAKGNLDPALEKIIKAMCEFCDVSTSYHEDLVGSCSVNTELTVTQPSPAPYPDSITNPDPEVFVAYSQVTKRKQNAPPVPKPAPKPPRDPKLQAFQDAVKHSERSTLIFNLNLGSKKTLNEKTILSNATLALSTAAAAVEGSATKTPSKDVVDILDES